MAKTAKPAMEENPPAEESTSRWSRYGPFLVIIVASALAHLWCLKSQFYLDDMPQIRDNDYIREGTPFERVLLSWFYLCLIAQTKLFGMSSMGIHAVNWLLHTSVACVLFASARDYLRESRLQKAALFGALLFAVHPLGSEIPNYARTQDLAWVTLFSLLAAWWFFKFLHLGKWWRLALTVIFIAGATTSKGPGFFHAMMMVGAVGVFLMPERHRTFFDPRRGRFWWFLGAAALLAVITLPINPWVKSIGHLGTGRSIGHAFTVARVFWEFTWRGFVPIHLSADHHIAETLANPAAKWWGVTDKMAWYAMIGIWLFAVVALIMACRRGTRLWGACLLLFVGSILMRVLYVVPEYMPEYRIYPGLPWFCLALAMVLTKAWQWTRWSRPWLPAAVLLCPLAFLSAKRSFKWHDLKVIMADVLEQYPWHMRAVWVMQRDDIEKGDWQAVIDRHQNLYPKVRERFIKPMEEMARRGEKPHREMNTGHFAMAEVGCTGIYARAIVHQQGAAAGLRVIDQLEGYMRKLRLDPVVHREHWSIFRHMKGLVIEAAGDYQGAADWLGMEPDIPVNDRKLDLERVKSKLPQ